MSGSYHPLVKRVLDGELGVSDLPPELRAEAASALRLLETLDRAPVTLPAGLEHRVMQAVRRRARSPLARLRRWFLDPYELRVTLRPWMAAPVLAAAVLLLVTARDSGRPLAGRPDGAVADSVFVRFMLYAPGARRVTLAGTFNEWDPQATPLAPAAPDLWTTLVAVPAGQHEYAFVVDGRRWVPDPAAPRVEDGFGNVNSVLSVERTATGGIL